jgi:hypothetical protein
MLNAFRRVAPSDRLRLFAMFAAGVFFRAIDFNVRTSAAVHARLFFRLFIWVLPVCEPMLVALTRSNGKSAGAGGLSTGKNRVSI